MAKKTTKKTAKAATTTAAKKTAKKTTTRAAAPAAPKPVKISPAKDKPRSKSEIYATLAESAGVSKKQVATIFDTMQEMIVADLKKNAVGKFSVPGMMRVTVVRKPATKATTRPDPFNPGQMMTVKAKPARNVVKVRPLKTLKSMV